MAKPGADVLDKHKGKEAKNMSINDYTLKIKGIVEPLASINVFADAVLW